MNYHVVSQTYSMHLESLNFKGEGLLLLSFNR